MAALPAPFAFSPGTGPGAVIERGQRARLVAAERVFPSNDTFPDDPCRLIHGDNLNIIRTLLDGGYAGKVNLIYIDPPFDSRSDYRHRLVLDGKKLTREAPLVDRLAYRDTWEGGIEAYLEMLLPRLRLMTELLAEDGNLFIHLDHRRVHYVKVLMDGILPGGFINEIIWHFNSGAREKCAFGRRHHTILRYAKDPSKAFLNLESEYARTPYSPDINVPASKAHYYHPLGKIHDDVWDIDLIPQNDRTEREGFATQKPLRLLKRIIGSCSRPGDLVADFFCGSGTTAVAAEQLGRRWIAADQSEIAIQVTKRRLLRPETEGFVVEKELENSRRKKSSAAPSKPSARVEAIRDRESGLVTVRIVDYRIDEVPLPKEQDRERVTGVLKKDFAYVMDSWSVDPHPNGGVFTSRFFRARNGKRDVEPVAKEISGISIPMDTDKVAVRITDVFGNDITLNAPVILSSQQEGSDDTPHRQGRPDSS